MTTTPSNAGESRLLTFFRARALTVLTGRTVPVELIQVVCKRTLVCLWEFLDMLMGTRSRLAH
jgi:hypothetical protein